MGWVPECVQGLPAASCVSEITAGFAFTLLRLSSGEVYSFGSAEHGQLGYVAEDGCHGSYDENSAVPRRVFGGRMLAAVEETS